LETARSGGKGEGMRIGWGFCHFAPTADGALFLCLLIKFFSIKQISLAFLFLNNGIFLEENKKDKDLCVRA
jgi:hypothetical protein